MNPGYDLFLSHSSADKPAVEELARRLREAGFVPFLDKWHLVPGRLWQPELEKGLRESRACAIFVGSEGFGPWHRQEMLLALDRGARDPEYAVIPVLLPGFSKPAEIPLFLAQRTWVEFPSLADEWAFHCLLCAIRGEAPGPGSGAAGPSAHYRRMAQPPEGFIHRSEYDEVLKALCPADGGVRSTSVGITTALRGAGGFGKTALAQALCQDPRVRETYPDGILWATMGEDIDANGRLARVRDLIRWWTEEKENPTFENVSAAASRLRALLAGRRVLVVVDDVWSSADVTPFQGMGPEAALLITTRDSRTLPSDAARIEVDAMAEPEAVSLLRFGLPNVNQEVFRTLAERLGEWPLLLKIVNRQIRELVQEDQLSPDKALLEVEEALEAQGLTAFDREAKEERNRAVSLTINASLTRLTEEERERYGQLAIFPEDADVPLSVLACLWGLDRFEAKTLCGRLHDLSLLLDFNRRSGTIRLHDVIRQFLIRQRQSEWPALHGHLLDTCPCWQDLPREEGYLWRHLASHLLGAGRREELRELLVDFSYLQAKLEATDINALIADYEPFIEERELRLVRDALRLSAHVLARDGRQLASQLLGRLLGFQGSDLQRLLQGTAVWREAFWLRPRLAGLIPPGGPLIRTLEGHTSSITAVAVVDGRRAVSGSKEGTLRVWNLETGEVLRVLKRHWGKVTALAASGRWVISAGSDERTLQVWDLETGEVLQTLEGHSGTITMVAVIDGCRVVSGSDDTTLRVWNLETGDALRILRGHSAKITALAVVDSHRIASSSSSYFETLWVWDLETGEVLQRLEGHLGGVNALVVDGGRAVSGSIDGTLRVWDLETGKVQRSLEGRAIGLTALDVVGRWAILGCADGMLRVLDLETGEVLRALEGHSDAVNSLAVIDGDQAISGSLDGLRLWALTIDETLRAPERHSGAVTALLIIDGRVISGSADTMLRVWDTETGKTLHIFEGHLKTITALAVVDGRRIISNSGDETLRVWDLETGETLKVLEGYPGRITALSIVDDRKAISGSSDGTLRVWDLETGEILHTLEGHRSWVVGLSVVNGRWAVSSSLAGPMQVWDLETGENLHTLTHSGWVKAIANVDGRRAVSGSNDGTLRVWDVEFGETLRTLEGALRSSLRSGDSK